MARALLAGGDVLVAVAFNQLIVNAVNEPRPYTNIPTALVLVARSADSSFPSDHAVMAGATAAGLLLLDRRLGLITTTLALLMAADRVYVGAHWPVDVIAGLRVGAVVAVAVTGLGQAPITGLVRRLESTPLRPLLCAGTPRGSAAVGN
jgi:undecaprenyl-diphosphatase